MFSLIFAGDLGRHRTHYDVTVMMYSIQHGMDRMCPRLCCASFCMGYIVAVREFMWLTYSYYSHVRHWYYGIHYSDVIMGAKASQITSLTIVYSIVYSGADRRKHKSSASLAFVRGIHRRPVNSPHKWPVTRKKFPLDDVIMSNKYAITLVTMKKPQMKCIKSTGT